MWADGHGRGGTGPVIMIEYEGSAELKRRGRPSFSRTNGVKTAATVATMAWRKRRVLIPSSKTPYWGGGVGVSAGLRRGKVNIFLLSGREGAGSCSARAKGGVVIEELEWW